MSIAIGGIALLIDIAILGLALSELIGEGLGLGHGLWLVVGVAFAFAVLATAVASQLRGRQRPSLRLAALQVCWIIPVAFFLGSFDHGIISGLEILSIIVVSVIGALNWLAMGPGKRSHA